MAFCSVFPPCALGIDIGGTNIVMGIVDSHGQVIARESVPTSSFPDPESIGPGIASVASRLASFAGVEPIGCGVGAPCLNESTGCIEGATDLPWRGVIPLRQMLSDSLGLPVMAVNDANAAAAGEGLGGAAVGCGDYVVLTLGTGVGAGIVSDARLLHGSRGFAGELGHIRVYDGEGRSCSCGRSDCLQTYASASGVVTTALRLIDAGLYPGSSLCEIPRDNLSASDIGRAADAGDPLALEVWRLTGRRIGSSCAAFAAALDPDMFILFGGVASSFRFMEKGIMDAFLSEALFLNADHVRFLPSSLSGSDAPLIGSAAMILNSDRLA